MIALPTAFLVGPPLDPQPGGEAGEPDVPVTARLHALGWTVVDSASLGDADLASAVRAADGTRVAVIDRRFVGHEHALRRIIVDPRNAAASGPGVVATDADQRGDLATALTTVGAGAGTDELDLAAVAQALQDHVPVTRVDLAPLVAGIATTATERAGLQARVDAVDEDRVRLEQARKPDDTFVTTVTIRGWSTYVARWLARLGISPNTVTFFSLAVGLVAAGLVATGTRVGYVGGALLFYAAFALDCIDGDLARYTLQFSRIGSWLDTTFDRVRDYVMFVGIALGGVRADGDRWIWGLAVAAMALQTVRHHTVFAYDEVTAGPDEAPTLSARVQARLSGSQWKVWLRRAIPIPGGERTALISLLVIFTTPRITFVVLLVTGVLAGAYATLGRLLRSTRRLRLGWSRRGAKALGAMVDVGPIGWILHFALPGRSLPAPLTTLIALLLVGGGLAVAPTAGWGWLVVAAVWYALLAGFASRQPLNGWADWVLPPSFRAAEYAVVLVPTLVIAPSAAPAAFAFVAASAYHQYDTVYRMRGLGTHPPRWLTAITGGHEGRLLVLSLLTLGGPQVWQTGLIVLAIWLAVCFLGESLATVVAWARSGRTGSIDIPEPDGQEAAR